MSELFQSIRENLSFLLVCLLVSAALAGIAALAERFRGERRRLSAAHTISFVAIFSAIAGVLMLLEIPLFFAPSFYKMDLSEIPVMICAFYLGPVSGVICEFIKVLLKLLLKGTTTNFVGDFANFAVGFYSLSLAPLAQGRDRGAADRHGRHDRIRQHVQRPLPYSEVCPALWDAARCHRRHGHAGELPYHQRRNAGAVCRRSLQSAQGADRLAAHLPALQACGAAVLPQGQHSELLIFHEATCFG